MASKIVEEMKEKMQLAGQLDLLAKMIPMKREEVPPDEPGPEGRAEAVAEPAAAEGSEHGSVTANIHLPLALRKQRRPNAGTKEIFGLHRKKGEGINTVKRLIGAMNSSIVGADPQQPGTKRARVEGKKLDPGSSSKKSADGRKKKKKKRSHSSDERIVSFRQKKKIRKVLRDGESTNDCYCWVCHKEGPIESCDACPRVFHIACLKEFNTPVENSGWFCPECEAITREECVDTQSKSLASLSEERLAQLLMCALQRMKHPASDPFLYPVNRNTAPKYLSFVFNPMDLSTIEQKIKDRLYGSPEALLADSKWIIHNCVIYNGSSNKITKSAQLITDIAEHEVNEIQVCPDCYLASATKKKYWFCEPCRTPHTLVWAKLKGFPFWPAKVLREKVGQLDVRFFGQHDRAWVNVPDCYLISKEMPFPPTNNKTNGLSQAVLEVEIHMQRLRSLRHECDYAAYRTPYDASRTYVHRQAAAAAQPKGAGQKGPRRGGARRRKRKGGVKVAPKRAHYIPVLRDLDPRGPPAGPPIEERGAAEVPLAERGETEREEGGVSADRQTGVSGDAASRLKSVLGTEEGRDATEIKTDANGTENVDVDDSGDKSMRPERDAVNTEEDRREDRMSADVEPVGPMGRDPATDSFTVDRKVYSRSGKVLALSSDISAHVGSVVRGDPQKVDPKGEDDRSGESEAHGPDVRADPGAACEGNNGAAGRIEKDIATETESWTDRGDLCKNNESERIIKEDNDSEQSKKTGANPFQSESADPPGPGPAGSEPQMKLPVPDDKPEARSEPVPDEPASGTRATPPKNDRFHQKLNQTIKSCRKFLGLESETGGAGREPASDDDGNDTRSEPESELDSDEDEKRETDSDATPLSPAEEEGSVRSGSPSRPADPHSGDSTDGELVIDEEGKGTGGTSSSSDAAVEGEGVSPAAGEAPLPSPILTIKLPFGTKGGKQRPLESDRDEEEEDDDYDGDVVVDAKGGDGDGCQGDVVMATAGDETAGEPEEDIERTRDGAGEEDGSVRIADRSDPEKDRPVGSDEGNDDVAMDLTSGGRGKTSVTVVKTPLSPPRDRAGSDGNSTDSRVPSDAEKGSEREAVVARAESGSRDAAGMRTGSRGEETSGKDLSVSETVRDVLRELCRVVADDDGAESRADAETRRIAQLEEELCKMKKMQMIQVQQSLETKAIYELMVAEVFQNYQYVLQDTVDHLNNNKELELAEIKRKQWCAYCQKEAVFFCCWNTSYCDYPCQQKHWALHQKVCQQTSAGGSAPPGGAPVPATTGVNATPLQMTPHTVQTVNSSQTINPGQGSVSAADHLRALSNQQTQESAELTHILNGQQVPLNQLGQLGTAVQANDASVIQFVRNLPKIFMPLNQAQLQNMQVPSQAQSGGGQPPVPPIQLQQGQVQQPAPVHQVPGLQPSQVQPAQAVQSAHIMASQQQMRSILPTYQQNVRGPVVGVPPPTNVIHHPSQNGNEIILHLPQNLRLAVSS